MGGFFYGRGIILELAGGVLLRARAPAAFGQPIPINGDSYPEAAGSQTGSLHERTFLASFSGSDTGPDSSREMANGRDRIVDMNGKDNLRDGDDERTEIRV